MGALGDDNDLACVVRGRFIGLATTDEDLAELDCDIDRRPPLFTSTKAVSKWELMKCILKHTPIYTC